MILRKLVSIVAFLMGAFGSFLTRIAPPDETKAGMMVGIASLAALLILLVISAIAGIKTGHRKYWFVSAVFFGIAFGISAYKYDSDRTKLTFLWPPNVEKQILYVTGGDQLTPAAEEIKRQHPEYTPTRLVSGFGGIDSRTSVWPTEAIQISGRKLKIDYLIMVLSVATAIFSVTEGLLGKNNNQGDETSEPTDS